jgi:group I intron endonuclease
MIIYCITNLVNGKKYIGSSIHNNPRYLGSGTYIKKAVKKYGRENFKKEILAEINTVEIMEELEMYWIDYFNACENPLFYNATKFSAGVSQVSELKGIKIYYDITAL